MSSKSLIGAWRVACGIGCATHEDRPSASPSDRCRRGPTGAGAVSENSQVVVGDFDLERDFGGLGIRHGFVGDLADVRAFNLALSAASTGVRVRTNRRRRHLVGTSEPQRLAAAMGTARAGRDIAGSHSIGGTTC